MDLTNFISTFEYASTQASRTIGSTNDTKRRIHSMKSLEEDGVGSSMLSMIRKSVGMQSQMHQASQNLIQKNAQILYERTGNLPEGYILNEEGKVVKDSTTQDIVGMEQEEKTTDGR